MALRSRPLGAAIALVSVVCSMPQTAHADEVDRCLVAHSHSQRLRMGGKLREARDEMLQCAREVCPRVVRSECGQWLAEVQREMPSIVVRARDTAMRDIVAVRVLVDGELVATDDRGQSLDVDPGVHVIRFETEGSPAVEQRVTIRQGEQNRMVSVTFEAPREAAAPRNELATSAPARSHAPETRLQESVSLTAPLILAGVGVLALGGFTYLAIDAGHDVDHLRASCAPGCPSHDVSSVRTKLIVANASLGVGVVSLGAAAWLFFSRSKSAPSTQIGVIPTSGGAAGFFAKTF